MQRRKQVVRWLRDLLCGVLIGAGGILPGVSGGVLAVIFGIYRPFMEVLTEPRKALPKYLPYIPALGLGCLIGFMSFAKGISVMLALSNTVTVWLFIGLIVGTLPQMFQEAGKEGRNRNSWLSLAVCFLGMFLGMLYMSHAAQTTVTPNFWWYNFCGALWGMGIIIPGMTSSSIMMALGIYRPVMDGLSQLNWEVLLSTVPGLVLTVALLSRFVSWFFKKHYSVAFHGILGIVLATTLAIIPTGYQGVGEVFASVLCCLGGFSLAFLLSKLDSRIDRKN